MEEKFDFNIEKLKKVLKKGDYYSKDLKDKSIFVLRKKEIEEIGQCFEFEDSFFGIGENKIEDEEKEGAILFIIGIIRDIVMDKKYEVIEGILRKDASSEVQE